MTAGNSGVGRSSKKGDFADGGEVGVQKGNLIVGTGKPATGVRLQGEFPRVNYEIELERKRVEGGDFFCGLTFQVDKGSLTLILGGWGGWDKFQSDYKEKMIDWLKKTLQ